MLEGSFTLDPNQKTQCCRNGAQKLLGVLITIGEAVAYVVSGMYGDVRELGAVNATLIILQVQISRSGLESYVMLIPASSLPHRRPQSCVSGYLPTEKHPLIAS